MGKSQLLLDAEGLSKEAGEWIARRLEDPSEQTRRDFAAWVCQSPSHLASVLITMGELRELTELDLRQELEQQRADDSDAHHGGITPSDHGRYIPQSQFLKVAFPLMVALAVVVALYFLTPVGKLFTGRAANVQEYSQAGTYILGVDSTMRLSAGSSARVSPFQDGKGQQVALLAGTADFSGTHDPSRPLRVVAGGTIIDVLGTEFEVQQESEVTTVAVRRGRVQLSSACEASSGATEEETKGRGGDSTGFPAVLVGGEIGVVSGTECSKSLFVGNSSEKTNTQGAPSAPEFVFFPDTTVREAVAMFNRYTSHHIVVSDPELANRRIGGAFRPADFRAFLEFLKKTLGANVTHTVAADGSDTIVVSSAPQR
jgi:transmembrane sensor